MKILLIHRYFWPDTPPYAVILKKIARRLAADGHDVTVLSTQPAYKPELANEVQPSVEVIDGYRVVRLSLLSSEIVPNAVVSALNILLFSARIVAHSLFNRSYQLVMISTSPPVLAGISARLISRICRAKFFYHCMDIHPEIGRLSGEFSHPVIFRLLQSLDNGTCNVAERVIVLSNDMRNAVENRSGYKRKNVEVIQNFDLNDQNFKSLCCPDEYKKEEGVFRLIFAGNIGRFQGLESVVESFMDVADESAELVFLGEGKLKAYLQAKVNERNFQRVKFFPHQSIDVANEIIRTSDIGIVSLSAGVYKYAYPTKVISYLSVACPLLVIIEPESDMAKFVTENQIGVCVDAKNKQSLSQSILHLSSNREQVERFKSNALNVYTSYYNENLVLDKWVELVGQAHNNQSSVL